MRDGVPTDPGYSLYGENHFCFPDGAPKKLFLSFEGITPGALWTPDMCKPMNGVYVCERVAATEWLWVGPNISSVGVDFTDTYTTTAADDEAAATQFSFSTYSLCVFSAENALQDPNGYMYGGRVVITSREPVLVSSMKSTCTDICIEPAKKTFDFVTPAANSKIVHRIARKSDRTRILVLRDIYP